MKIRLVPHVFERADDYLRNLLERELTLEGPLEARFADNTREVQHLTDAEYDQLLAENLAFIRLYDASANNTVVECIARATPLLVNPLPAVVEYLGPNYPFYFKSLAEAADKAMDLGLIERTHEYLRSCDTRPQLTAARFRDAFIQSEVYRRLWSHPQGPRAVRASPFQTGEPVAVGRPHGPRRPRIRGSALGRSPLCACVSGVGRHACPGRPADEAIAVYRRGCSACPEDPSLRGTTRRTLRARRTPPRDFLEAEAVAETGATRVLLYTDCGGVYGPGVSTICWRAV